jgi:hypothetical protein
MRAESTGGTVERGKEDPGRRIPHKGNRAHHNQTKDRAMKYLKPAGLILALVTAIALGAISLVVALGRPTQAELRVARGQLVAVQRQLNQIQGLAGQMDTTNLHNAITQINACLPELEAQVSGMNVTSSYITDATLVAGQTTDLAEWPMTVNLGPQLSLDCQRLLSQSCTIVLNQDPGPRGDPELSPFHRH